MHTYIHYITLHYITLHYIHTYRYMYIHVCIRTICPFPWPHGAAPLWHLGSRRQILPHPLQALELRQDRGTTRRHGGGPWHSTAVEGPIPGIQTGLGGFDVPKRRIVGVNATGTYGIRLYIWHATDGKHDAHLDFDFTSKMTFHQETNSEASHSQPLLLGGFMFQLREYSKYM